MSFLRPTGCRAAASLLCGLLLSLPLPLPLAGQESGDLPNSHDPVRLQLIPYREAPAWLLRTITDGLVSWHLDMPEGRAAEASLAALVSGGRLSLIDELGRLSDPGPFKAELERLASAARNRGQAPEARARHLERNSPYYFPGWEALDFSWAKGDYVVAKALKPLAGEGRALDVALPSPALVDPRDPVEVLLVVKMNGDEGLEGLLIQAEAEYIEGEREFFSTRPAYAEHDYNRKALAFFGMSFEPGAGREVFREASAATYPDLGLGASDWAIFEGDPGVKELKHRLATHFLNTMLGAADNFEDVKIFSGGDRATWFEAMYGVNRLPQISAYLRYCYDAAMPLFVSAIEEAYSDYDYSAFTPISVSEGLELARAAMRYYSWGVDYRPLLPLSSGAPRGPAVTSANLKMLSVWASANKGDAGLNYAPSVMPLTLSTLAGADGLPAGWAAGLALDSPYDKGSAGSPLPFAKGGKDSPKTFATAMMAASAGTASSTEIPPPPGAGVDALGFLTGALAQTSLAPRIRALDNATPALSFDSYFRGSRDREGLPEISPGDLEKISLLVPDLRELRAGDLLIHYGPEAKEMRIAVVLYVPPAPPTPGSDPSAFLRQVVVVSVSEGDTEVRLGTWASDISDRGLSPTGAGFQARRILVSR